MANSPIIYLVRHGNTALNSNSTEPERFRAWSNPPLNEEGISDAHKAGAFLADKGITHIFSSDLGRTLQTSHVISQYTHAPVSPVHGLRPWNLGEYTGKPVETNKESVQKFQNDTPDTPIPGGESYNTFAHRNNTTFKHLMMFSMEHGPIAAVAHTRNVNQVKDTASGKKRKSIDGAVSPGGIVKMEILNGKLKLTDEEIPEGLHPEAHHFQE